MLLERSGEVVTREELFRDVWPDTAVSDAALTTCIQELRRALADDARHPRYIETRAPARLPVSGRRVGGRDGRRSSDRRSLTSSRAPGPIVGRDAALDAAVAGAGARA